MNCNEIKKLIPLYIKGMVEKEISNKIEKHLKECTDCAKAYEFEQKVSLGLDDFFANVPEIVTPSPFKQNQQQKSTSVSPFLKWGLTAAAVIGFSVSLLFINTDKTHSPNIASGKYVEAIKDAVTKNVEIKNVKYICSKTENVEVKKLKENIVWLTVRN